MDQQWRGNVIWKIGNNTPRAVPISQIGLVSASSSINVNRSPAAMDNDDNTALARRSFSMAMTCAAPSRSKARVSPPGPGPISMVVPVSGPALRAIFRVRFKSNRKFCPAICVPAYPCFRQADARGQGVNAGCYIAIFHDEAASDVLAILRAIVIAAIKLSGRAAPDPAISKPVP